MVGRGFPYQILDGPLRVRAASNRRREASGVNPPCCSIGSGIHEPLVDTHTGVTMRRYAE